jgi:hypothetical protein
MLHDRTYPYTKLIQEFLNGTIDVEAFERNYLNMFKDESSFFPYYETYLTLNNLFLDVDAFCADPTLRGKYDISEEQLRDACQVALKKLENQDESKPGVPWPEDRQGGRGKGDKSNY